MNSLLAGISTYSTESQLSSTQSDINRIVTTERQSDPPLAARQFSRAIAAYMEHVADHVITGYTYQDQLAAERLFAAVQSEEGLAANACGIQLTG